MTQMLDGKFGGVQDRRKPAKSSPRVVLWMTYAAVARPTPSELGDRSILVPQQSQKQANPGFSKDFHCSYKGIL